MNTPPRIGVQLWTLRRHLDGDLPATLGSIADMGYAGAELWFQDWPEDPTRLRRALADAGLEAPSAHVGFMALRDDLDRVAAYHREWNIDVGLGTVDWEAVRSAIDPTVLQWCFVEQDCRDADEFESLRRSYANLKRLGFVG